MTGAPVVLRAHAKLTLALKLTGVRDDGYHLIDAEMVSLALHDTLTFDRSGDALSTSGPFSGGVPTDRTNLVARALELAGTTARVHIDKHIPYGGGLGGGSSDAATALRWAGFGTSRHELERAGALGADIPFCLMGGRARVRGIGEIVDPLDHVDRAVTLISPPLAVSTPAAYQTWDVMGGPTTDGPNDLTAAAIRVEPALAWWHDAIGHRCGVAPTLAGSGATWFVEGEHEDALTDLVGEGATVVETTTVSGDVACGHVDLPEGGPPTAR